jgi:hypothetical protein
MTTPLTDAEIAEMERFRKRNAGMMSNDLDRLFAAAREANRLRALIQERLAIESEEIAARPTEHGGPMPNSYLDTLSELCVRTAAWKKEALSATAPEDAGGG